MKFINLISGSGSTNLKIFEEEKFGGALYGLTETLAIISSGSNVKGIDKAKSIGFPVNHIHIINPKDVLFEPKLLNVFNEYKPDYFHQLGWIPKTPQKVLEKYSGINQHLGPGGNFMYGERRIFSHALFCSVIGKKYPVPIFCQLVGSDYDEGDMVYCKYEYIHDNESLQDVAGRLLEIEHRVQVVGRSKIARNDYCGISISKISRNKVADEIFEHIR